jgi:hypothetical protein
MPKVAVTVDAKAALNKLKLLQSKLKSEGALAIEELGELGKAYARNKAPYDSGKTFRNIILPKITGTTVIIKAQNPTASDGHKRGPASTKYFTNGKFNLVRWMHLSSSAGSHIHSGDPRFMYRTSAYLKRVAPGRVQGRYNKVVAEINRI